MRQQFPRGRPQSSPSFFRLFFTMRVWTAGNAYWEDCFTFAMGPRSHSPKKIVLLFSTSHFFSQPPPFPRILSTAQCPIFFRNHTGRARPHRDVFSARFAEPWPPLFTCLPHSGLPFSPFSPLYPYLRISRFRQLPPPTPMKRTPIQHWLLHRF